MKSLNKSKELWTNMSAKEVENSSYASSCCLNVRISSSIDGGTGGEIKKDEKSERE